MTLQRGFCPVSTQLVEFPVDGFSMHGLPEGVDELGYILHQAQHPAPINALENIANGQNRFHGIDTGSPF
jgi:hypothetical protein